MNFITDNQKSLTKDIESKAYKEIRERPKKMYQRRLVQDIMILMLQEI